MAVADCWAGILDQLIQYIVHFLQQRSHRGCGGEAGANVQCINNLVTYCHTNIVHQIEQHIDHAIDPESEGVYSGTGRGELTVDKSVQNLLKAGKILGFYTADQLMLHIEV